LTLTLISSFADLVLTLPFPVNGAVSAFGPLIVSTFGYTPKTALLWQMPLGAVCLVTTLACGYASLLFKNVRLIMLMLCCLPVIAGCAMIWKGTWSEGGATPLAGYTLIGFFAPVTSLIVSMGMVNVAGNTKKSFMASGIFVMYCVGKSMMRPSSHQSDPYLGPFPGSCNQVLLESSKKKIIPQTKNRYPKLIQTNRKHRRPLLDPLATSQPALPARLARYYRLLRSSSVRRCDFVRDSQAGERTTGRSNDGRERRREACL
jgi:hypothetical protein